MKISGKIISKTITADGVFARVSLGWSKKNALMRFFDVPDEDNFEIGQKIEIGLYAPLAAPEPCTSAHFGLNLDDTRIIPGCMFHSAPDPADIVGAIGVELEPPGCESPAFESVVLDPIGVAPVVVDEKSGEEYFYLDGIPLPAPTAENMTERSDSDGAWGRL